MIFVAVGSASVGTEHPIRGASRDLILDVPDVGCAVILLVHVE